MNNEYTDGLWWITFTRLWQDLGIVVRAEADINLTRARYSLGPMRKRRPPAIKATPEPAPVLLPRGPEPLKPLSVFTGWSWGSDNRPDDF